MPALPSDHHRRRQLLLWALGLAGSAPAAVAQGPATVAAASDLKFALEAVAERFQRDTGHNVRLVFGSSGVFTSQILQGAPFHLFLSADEAFVFKLADANLTRLVAGTRDRGRLYAFGRIGLMVPHGSPLKADGELRDLALALQDGRLKKFAIANPDHAPYGMRAREALRHAGLWDAIEPRLVYGENITQAAQFATSGAAEGGIIAESLAKAPQLAALGRFALIPASFHQPLAQRMVLLQGAPPAAVALYDYLAQPGAQEILSRFGFVMPGR